MSDNNEVVFPEKWNKVLKNLPEFKDTADAASVDDLKKIIVSSENNIYEIEREKSEDVKLNGAKDLVKEYSSSYNESIKCQTAKIKYALFCLQGKGADMSSVKED